MGFLNTNSMPRLVEKLADGDNIKITGNSKGNRVGTVIKKIVEKADDVTKAIEQEVVNDGYSFKVGTGDVDVSTDVEDGFGEVGVKGVTYQNLWNINKVNGATIEGNTVKVLASANNYKFCGIYLKDSCLKPNTTYTLITNVFENTLDGRFNPCIGHSSSVFKKSAKEFQAKTTGVSMSVLTTTSTFTTEDIGIRTIVLNDCTEGFIKYNMLILEGDYSNASNLPSYFEGIVGVGDKSKNLFNSLDKTYDKQWIKSNGKLILSDAVGRTAFNHFIPCKPNTNYYFSSDTTIGLKGIFEVSDLEGNNCKLLKNTDATKESFTTTSSAKFIVIKANTIVSDNITIQLEEGSTATAYEPYYDGHKIEILSNGKNLWNGKMYSGWGGASPTMDELGCRDNVITDFIRVARNKNCFINKAGFAYAWLYDLNKNLIDAYHGNINAFDNGVATKNADYIILGRSLGSSQINKEEYMDTIISYNKNDSFIESKSDKTQILLDEPLMRLPNGVCDEITRDGKLIRRVGKVVLDGSEYWSKYTPNETSSCFGHVIDDIATKYQYGLVCDRFASAKDYYPNSVTDEGINQHGNKVLLIRINHSRLSSQDVAGFKQWLSQNPTTVYYELETPITTELPAPYLRIFKDGHLTFNTLVAPESNHVVQINKSAQIERSIREVQGLDARVERLEGFYDDMILETAHKLSTLDFDFSLIRKGE